MGVKVNATSKAGEVNDQSKYLTSLIRIREFHHCTKGEQAGCFVCEELDYLKMWKPKESTPEIPATPEPLIMTEGEVGEV